MANVNGSKQAVVLSGGGADGAYAVGVLKALCFGQSPATNFQPLVPDIFTGTSVGAYNAAFLVSQWDTYGKESVTNLERAWLDILSDDAQKCGNGVFRIRANPVKFLNPLCFIPTPLQPFSQLGEDSAILTWEGLQRAINFATAPEGLLQRAVNLLNFSSFVSREPLVRSLRETIQFPAIYQSKRALRIAATNWATGDVQIFNNLDMTDQLGPLAILASSAIPGIFPMTEIGEQPFVDGGVLINTPLKPAIDAGAENLHVIYLDSDVRNIPLPPVENTVSTLYRMQLISWAQTVEQDIETAKRINLELAFEQLAPEAVKILQRTPYLRRVPDHRPLTIYTYHPRSDPEGALGALDFSRDRLQRLIEQGFNDTIDLTRKSQGYEIVQPLFPLPPLSQPEQSNGVNA